jgi:hypothetical protein
MQKGGFSAALFVCRCTGDHIPMIYSVAGPAETAAKPGTSLKPAGFFCRTPSQT